MTDIKKDLLLWFFDKKSSGSGVNIPLASNEELAEELHKPIIKIFFKKTVCSGSKDNIWGADLADMQLISNFNKGFRFLLCVIDIFSKYDWVVPLKDKRGVNIVDAFQKVLDDSNRKPNKIWVDKGSEFYNSSFKKWLKDNDIEMYSTHNEEKSAAAERFIRTLMTKIYKDMTTISKNVYINKLDDTVNECNNTYHITVKTKHVDVKDNTYIDFKKEVNDKNPKFKVGDHEEFLNTKIFSLKDTHQTGVTKFLYLKKLKILFHGHVLLMISMVKKLLEHFMKRNYKRLIIKNLG